MPRFDLIVLGLGGVGSSALYHAARRGKKVLGIDRFAPGHDRGSSHGETRIIREAYFEHPDYVPLLTRSYRLWHELEHFTGRPLFHQVGLLQVGPEGGVVVPGVLRSARSHGLSIEQLTADEVRRRYPGVAMRSGDIAALEKRAGYLMVEKCVLAHLEAAQRHGASRIDQVTAQTLEATANGIAVRAGGETFLADRLVIAAGAWSKDLLHALRVPLKVLRKHLYWFADGSSDYLRTRGFPTFFFESPSGMFYGFPQIDSLGLKVARHSGGIEIDDPTDDPRPPDPEDRRLVREFLDQSLPGVGPTLTREKTCFYTMSPDEHFIIDRHPDDPRVAFAAGLSGHGFKFTSGLGEILVDLALDGGTSQPIDFLSLKRFTAQ